MILLKLLIKFIKKDSNFNILLTTSQHKTIKVFVLYYDYYCNNNY